MPMIGCEWVHCLSVTSLAINVIWSVFRAAPIWLETWQITVNATQHCLWQETNLVAFFFEEFLFCSLSFLLGPLPGSLFLEKKQGSMTQAICLFSCSCGNTNQAPTFKAGKRLAATSNTPMNKATTMQLLQLALVDAS